jgi:nicotinate-nucleotide pyrophosphorylase (carboxylating)
MNDTLDKHKLFKLSATEFASVVLQNVEAAIAEDVGNDLIAGDLTAQLIPATELARAKIISRESAVICGKPWIEQCFKLLAPNSSIRWLVNEGAPALANDTLCEITGNAREILTAERTALNFLQTLSATATITRQYVDAIAGTSARIMDTRKTIPGLRMAQKYAVVIGGGLNQRLALYDGILIKENHIMAAGSIEAAMQAACNLHADVGIQIEVETLTQLTAAIQAGASNILLDNFKLPQLSEAVKLANKRAILEASGGINLENVREVALTGVDRISIGSLTKHIQAIDLSLRFY